jgi:hypothetical protein
MATTSRQTAIFGVEDWKQIYQTYREADFQSYDFETLRKSFIDYLRLYYPETFNDYIESSEFIALLDIIAFMGQSLAFRTDLNTRENYLDTAERRDSVVKLANLVSYTAKRNTAAQGLLKVFSVSTTENVVDYQGVNLSNVVVDWADPTNPDWQEQFTAILNAALVNTQRVGRPGNRQNILNVRTEEYAINMVPGFLPVVPYTATVDGVTMPFEAVTSTSVGENYLYEPAPRPNQPFNILFRNDQLGFASQNTGYFFMFKQGVLQNQDFNLAERISNRTVNINIEGVNNEDRWLFQLDNLGNINREWQFAENIYAAAGEQLETDLRPIYSVTSRTNDQITMVFGDGVFSEIPVGTFRAYVRASNGLQYIINPEEMQNVTIPISYISRRGNLETLTFTCGITQPVSNSQARESINEIKQRAPARFYTQNRMVNGEDYNLFPYTQFTSIVKSKALNRSSIGTSRYLDLVDNTGKYSSTNTFGSDGGLWQQNILPTVLFSWLNRNDIVDVINNQVSPALAVDTMKQFYYSNFPRKLIDELEFTCTATADTSNTITTTSTEFFNLAAEGQIVAGESVIVFADPIGGLVAGLSYYVKNINPGNSTFTVSTTPTGDNVTLTTASGTMAARVKLSTSDTVWQQSTALGNTVTGYFKGIQNSQNVPVPVGSTVTNSLKYIVVGSLIKFAAPTGQYFDSNNRLQTGVPQRANERTTLWASPLNIIGTGDNQGLGNLPSGQGPITLNTFVPTGAVVDTVIPLFITDIPISLEQAMTEQIALYRNFGIAYNNSTSTWYLITSTNLDEDAAFSLDNAGSTAGTNSDASWLVQFVTENENYTITFRGLAYSFGSVLQTRFFYKDGQQVYDSRTGTVIRDFINVLASNTKRNDSEPLGSDTVMAITGQPVESDGFVDDFQVLVGFSDADNDGIPDDPDFFNNIVGTVPATPTANSPWVFLQQTVDFDNLERYLLVDPGRVNSSYANLAAIELAKNQWSPGQVFYAYNQNPSQQDPGAFYQLSISTTGIRTIVPVSGWIARTGRQGLYYQYRHNSPLTSRIDPGTTNIIDLYVVTQNYYTAYQNWLRDTTNTVPEPDQPTIDELSTAYQELQDFKMISDNIVLNSVTFKPLFGIKAAPELRATIKVIRAQGSTASTSEIKSSVVTAMNDYFSIDKWNFGDTFYFSELAAFLHRTLGSIISSVVLVPLNRQKSFGDLYEIRSAPDEIFANGATIDNIDVIDALTSSNLRTAPGSGVI